MVTQQTTFQPGDCVIFRMPKTSVHPGPRARNVRPARFGDTYRYTVDKCWVVQDILEDGRLVLRTRRGKIHTVDPNDPRLRRPSWWELLRYRQRFSAVRSGMESNVLSAGN